MSGLNLLDFMHRIDAKMNDPRLDLKTVNVIFENTRAVLQEVEKNQRALFQDYWYGPGSLSAEERAAYEKQCPVEKDRKLRKLRFVNKHRPMFLLHRKHMTGWRLRALTAEDYDY